MPVKLPAKKGKQKPLEKNYILFNRASRRNMSDQRLDEYNTASMNKSTVTTSTER